MERDCWYPKRDRGEYIPIEYADDKYLNKDWVCDCEEDCQKICDKLNEEINTKIRKVAQKCFAGIVDAEDEFNIDRRFLIPKFQSMFENIKAEAERK